ncbi:pyruvate ferredoxin oxidoreductase [Candidatus Woesearchaeota archaeon]|nr:pyruvate ferredoxin oxidoreductase [Candidatus Woesearchaeota archaeon]
MNIKELTTKEHRMVSGHRMCPGCGAPIVVKQVLMGTDNPVVVANATGCLEVSTTIYPYTAWTVPFIHNAFENAAATISGVEAAYTSLKKQGKIKSKKDIKFVAFGGDGGTYDIGLQSLSGALERGHNFVYVCYDNEGYMNTGIQRSSATPYGASTTTAPAGKVHPGKEEFKKDLTAIAVAHNIPYVAQASISNWNDLIKKAEKAFNTNGPAFLNVLAPCPRGWRFREDLTIELAKIAVSTNFWPLYEVENGKYVINYEVKDRKPIEEFIKLQGRFSHLFKPENKHMIEKMQAEVDRRFAEIKAKSTL